MSTAAARRNVSVRSCDTRHDEILDGIVQLAQHVFDGATCWVVLVDTEPAGIPTGITKHIPPESCFTVHAMVGNDPLAVPDLLQDPRFRDHILVASGDGLRFCVAQRLTTADNRPFGALVIASNHPRTVTDQELEIVRDLAALVEGQLTRLIREHGSHSHDLTSNASHEHLPKAALHLPGYHMAGVCLPARAVGGGDFFDWYRVRDGFQIVLADVMGKGLRAGLLAANFRTMLRSHSRATGLGEAVRRTSAQFGAQLRAAESFATLFAARLDVTAHTLTYVDAGHGLSALFDPTGNFTRLKSADLPIGVPAPEHWTEHTVEFPAAATLFLISDGILDYFESLTEIRTTVSAWITDGAFPDTIVDHLTATARTKARTDDATTLIVRRHTV